MRNNWLKAGYVITFIVICMVFILPIKIYAEQKAIYITVSNDNVKSKQSGEKSQESSDNNNQIQKNINNTKNKDKKNKSEEPNLKSSFNLLGAIFGVGCVIAIVLSILNRFYLSRNVAALPVLYYGEGEDNVNV